MFRIVGTSIALALLCQGAWAAPSILHDDGIKTSTTAAGSIQPTVAPTAGNLAVLLLSDTCASSAETITDSGGNTWTKDASAATNGDNCAIVWHAKLTSVAGAPYVVNYSGVAIVATPNGFEFLEIIGFDSTTPVDGTPQATNYANAAATTISQPVGSATIASDLAIIVASYNSSETTTPTAPITSLQTNNTLSSPMWSGSGTITGTGATTLAGSFTVSTKRATAGVLIKAAAGGSCTHAGYTSAGATAIPNGTTGSYWLKTGAFGTPDCTTVNYWQPGGGAFGTN